MNIFFKLLAIFGLGGTIGGATYFSKQEYTTRFAPTITKKSSKSKKTIDIKRQPTMGPQIVEDEDEDEDEEIDDETQDDKAEGGAKDNPQKSTKPKPKFIKKKKIVMKKRKKTPK